jgi:hypothetical protein
LSHTITLRLAKAIHTYTGEAFGPRQVLFYYSAKPRSDMLKKIKLCLLRLQRQASYADYVNFCCFPYGCYAAAAGGYFSPVRLRTLRFWTRQSRRVDSFRRRELSRQ